MTLWWMVYRLADGSLGTVALESSALIQARMHASVKLLDRGGAFVEGLALDQAAAARIPRRMIGRMLEHGDLEELAALATKKPAAPSVRRKRVRKPRQRVATAP